MKLLINLYPDTVQHQERFGLTDTNGLENYFFLK